MENHPIEIHIWYSIVLFFECKNENTKCKTKWNEKRNSFQIISNVIEWLKRNAAPQFITKKYKAKNSFNSLSLHGTFAQARQTSHTDTRHFSVCIWVYCVPSIIVPFSLFLVFIPLSICFMFLGSKNDYGNNIPF